MAQGDIFAGMLSGLELPDVADILKGVDTAIIDLHRMIEPLLSQLADHVDSIAVDITNIAKSIASGVAPSQPPPNPPTPPDKPGKNVWVPSSQLGNLFNTGKNFASSLASGSATAGLNLAGMAAKGLASGLTGGAATAAGILGPLAAGVTVAAGALAGLTAASISLTRSFAEFSPHLTAVFTQSQVRGIIRSQRIGEMTAGSTDRLLQSIDRLKDTLAPVLAGLINGINKVVTPVIEMMVNIIESIGRFEVVMTALVAVLDAMSFGIAGEAAKIIQKEKPEPQPLLNKLVQQMQNIQVQQRPVRRLN